MKKLGFGLMRMPVSDRTNAADVDIGQVKWWICLWKKGLPILILRSFRTF